MGHGVDGRLDRNDDHVGLACCGHVRRGAQPPAHAGAPEEFGQPGLAPSEGVASRIDRVDLLRIHVDADDLGACSGDRCGDRHAHIA